MLGEFIGSSDELGRIKGRLAEISEFFRAANLSLARPTLSSSDYRSEPFIMRRISLSGGGSFDFR